MTPEQRQSLAEQLRVRLNSRRDIFVVDPSLFNAEILGGDGKTVSAAVMRLLLDYCESAWDMDFVTYCAGIFHGREPTPGESAFDLLPDVRGRLSADRLGFGHIYGGR